MWREHRRGDGLARVIYDNNHRTHIHDTSRTTHTSRPADLPKAAFAVYHLHFLGTFLASTFSVK